MTRESWRSAQHKSRPLNKFHPLSVLGTVPTSVFCSSRLTTRTKMLAQCFTVIRQKYRIIEIGLARMHDIIKYVTENPSNLVNRLAYDFWVHGFF